MRKVFHTIIHGLLAVTVLTTVAIAVPSMATAQTPPRKSTNTVINNDDVNLPQVKADSNTAKTALQLIFGLIGGATVVYIIYQAIHFMHSQGDPQTVAKARQGILYAVIGLVIALSAETIVTFTLGKL